MQLANHSRGPSRYGQTTHKDPQEADKPVLPTLGGDRGVGNIQHNKHFIISYLSPVSPEGGSLTS